MESFPKSGRKATKSAGRECKQRGRESFPGIDSRPLFLVLFLAPRTARRIASVALVLLCCTFVGCSLTRTGTNTSPVAFHTRPDLSQVIDAVNANSSRVQQLHSDNVRLSIPGQFGRLSATLDFERSPNPGAPGRFRLSGEALGSRQLDLGSNDDRYWMWVKQNQPPTVFWGRHDQFYQGAAQQFLPVPPSWIAEALGVVAIDPNEVIDNQLYESAPGLFRIRSRIPTPHGNLLRILEVDQRRALIVQQQIYDSTDQLLAVADTSDFTYDALNGISLPRTAKIRLPPAGLAFDFEVDRYTINQSPANPSQLWSVPDIPGHQYRDLSNPGDMRGVNLMGAANPDFYDSRSAVRQPIRPEPPRAAWLRMPSMSIFR